MFLKVDGTFFVQLLNFAIFFAILKVVFLDPVSAAIRKRRAYIDGVQSDHDRHAADARTARSTAAQRRAAALRAADEAVAASRKHAEAEADTLLRSRGAQAAEIADAARREIAGEMSAARLREDELASTLAESLLQRATGAGA